MRAKQKFPFLGTSCHERSGWPMGHRPTLGSGAEQVQKRQNVQMPMNVGPGPQAMSAGLNSRAVVRLRLMSEPKQHEVHITLTTLVFNSEKQHACGPIQVQKHSIRLLTDRCCRFGSRFYRCFCGGLAAKLVTSSTGSHFCHFSGGHPGSSFDFVDHQTVEIAKIC